MYATNYDKGEIVNALIKAGADVNAKGYYFFRDTNATALIIAAYNGETEIVNALIRAGADVNDKNDAGGTALIYAGSENLETVNALIKAGADVNAKNKEGRTALMSATFDNNVEKINALIAAGANVKARDNDGKMAVDYARNNPKLKGTDALKRLEQLSGTSTSKSSTFEEQFEQFLENSAQELVNILTDGLNGSSTAVNYQGSFPVSATIKGNKVNVRRSPSIKSSSMNQLNSGHPVSVSKQSSESDGNWYSVRTASGTEGWVKGDYVSLNNNLKRERQEIENRKKSLPARGVVSVIVLGNRTGNKLNLRDLPSAERSSKVITEITTGDGLTAYEIFADERQDWYRIRTDNYEEGWVSGRFIELR